MERLFLSSHTNVQDVRNKISSQFVIKNPHWMTTIQYPYSKWLRGQSQYPTDFDLTSIRLNWTETLADNGPFQTKDQLPSWIKVWRYFGKIYWVKTTKLLLSPWHLLHWQISFKSMKISNQNPQYLPILNIFNILNIFQSSTPPFFLRGFPPEEQKLRRVVGKFQNFSNITFSMVWFGKLCQHLFFICFVFATTSFARWCRV